MTRDGERFYYSRYDVPEKGKEMVAANRNHKVYFHRLGTDQSDDELIYEDPDHPDWLFFGSLSDDDRYFVISVWQGAEINNGIYYIETTGDTHGKVVRLMEDFEASYSFVGNNGGTLYFLTNLDAPRYRLIAVDLSNPRKEHWREVIPETEDVLQTAQLVGGRFVAIYMHDAANRIRIFEEDGKMAGDVPLPAIGSVAGISGKKESDEMFFSFKSFAYPPTAYRYDLGKRDLKVFRRPETGIDPEDFVTEQIFFSSADGQSVPVFLSYKKGALVEGETPVYLYGYGGFGVSMTPYFDVANVLWMEMGGIFALVTARGGGEYGEDWHRAGILENRENVYNDFIGAAEYLIAEGYTSRDRLAIGGASNGGQVVGVCMTQRPDLFAVALPDVGVYDMLRYHMFTIGWAWAADYGRADNPHHYPFLLATSPYHNLRQGIEYPATLVTTADHDDRVVPAHSFKYAARLQACHAGDTPVLIRIETKAGHGGMSGTEKKIALATDQLSFMLENLGMSW